MSSVRLQLGKNNHKLKCLQLKKWSQSLMTLMRGSGLREVPTGGLDWETFGVLDGWLVLIST